MDTQAIADRLRTLRTRRNESQQEVADAIGISVSAYSMYENGERIPRDRTKIKIAKHFGRSVGFIFYAPVDTDRER